MPALNLGNQLPSTRTYKNISEFVYHNIFSGLPYQVGLKGAYFLSSQTISPLINYANDSLPLTVVGSPVVGDKYATMTTTDYYDTGLPSTLNMAVMAVTLPLIYTTPTGGIIIGDYYRDSSNNPYGDVMRCMNLGSANDLAVFGDFSGTSLVSIDANTTNIALGVMAITYGIINNSSTNSVGGGYYDPVNDTNIGGYASGTAPGARRVDSTKTLRIGTSILPGDLAGPSPISVILIFDNSSLGLGVGEANGLANMQWLYKTFGPEYSLWS